MGVAESDYRTSALEVRTLQVNANHARGSLTVGTLAAIILALTFAWYPTINRSRFDLDCKAVPGGGLTLPMEGERVECTLERDILFFHKVETLYFTRATAAAYVDSSSAVPEECPKCSRVIVRSREASVALGRFPATLAEADKAAGDLNEFFADPLADHVHVGYGPGGYSEPVLIFWLSLATLLAASLIVRRFHRVILKWDPVEHYLTVERRRWPFPRKIDHIPNEALVGVMTSGDQLLDTQLLFGSGRRVSLFGRTVANPRVHEQAVAQIQRFLAPP